MTSTPDLDSIAARIRGAQDTRKPIEPVSSGPGAFTVSDGYAVARRIHAARLDSGATPVGRKIGFTNPALWPQYGVHAPIWGHAYDRTVAHADDGCFARTAGAFAAPRIEPEIVLHFAKAPPEDAGPEALTGCIDWIAHAFEIVQCHYPDWRFQAADAIADNALHGALLVGPPLAIDALGPDPVSALETVSVSLSRDGEVLETGHGSNVLGGPVAAAAHLIATLAADPEQPPLAAGELVTTGTLTPAHPFAAGQHWRTAITGITLSGLTLEVHA